MSLIQITHLLFPTFFRSVADSVGDRGGDCIDPVQPELAREEEYGRRRQVGAVVQRQLHEAHLLVSDNS